MTDHAREYVERGLYNDALEDLQRRKRLTASEAVSLIGAHAFLGQLEEALQHWDGYRRTLSESEQIRCRFFLGVSATRASRLKLGREFFRANLEHKENPAARPYACQGRAFYLYYAGRFADARRWANKAVIASLKAKDHYLRFLALELLGHCKIQLGQRSEGLRMMKRASELARAHGNLNFASSFANASLVYEAELGVRPRTIVRELKESLAGLKAQDSYTRSVLGLELARQWTLRGRWAEARELLNREAASIYASGNRRLEVSLQLRLAEIAVYQGDRFSLEHFLRSATRCLLRVADRAFEVRILGLQMKARALFGQPEPAELRERLALLSRTHNTHIGDQILFRQGMGPDPMISEAEDPLHHLFLRAQTDGAKAATEALRLGYLGLWHRFSRLEPGRCAFIALEGSQDAVLASPEGVVLRRGLLTRQFLLLLQVMSAGSESKEELVRAAWGYRYDKLRHDPLLHSTIAKLRKALEPYGAWIVTTERGWRLSTEVRWEIPRAEKRPERPAATDDAPGLRQALNFRQIDAIKRRAEGEPWSIQQYKLKYRVSTMTAFRDLTALTGLGYLARTGKGRATRYHVV